MRKALTLSSFSIAILMFLSEPARAQTPASDAAKLNYPVTEALDVVDEQFGVKVHDPYRWLENDVREDPKVQAWVAAQNGLTEAYLATLPGRDAFKARMAQLFDYERFGLPVKKGNRYFYTRNDGLQNQAALWVRDGLDGEPRILIDPNMWADDGATALGDWIPSDDGRYLLYSMQEGGTDWRTVKLMDAGTGQVLPDTVEWVKFSGFSWAADGSGFYYSRFPETKPGEKFQATNENQAVYFHKVGDPQSADRLVFATPDHPKRGHGATVSDDGKWLVVTSSEGTDDRYAITLIDIARPGAAPHVLIPDLVNNWSYIGNRGTTFFWLTNKDAPRLRIVSLDIAEADPGPVELVPEDAATLDGASIVGDTLIASYLVDAKTEIRRFALDGTAKGRIDLPGIGTAGGFRGRPGDPETFYVFTSFATPAVIYRYDAAADRSVVWAEPKVPFDPDAFQVEQRFYASRDGTRVPLFLVRKKTLKLKKGAPTILYGYGGFNISLTPGFSATRLTWLEQGGVLAIANLRGGGEYGKGWHDAGRLQNKQNVFDDFIAAGEYLIAEGITTRDKLIIQGGSNGGLLVGAVVNQRPDLFAVALPAVGVMDMLRFDRFTAGRYWVDDYGYPSKESDFRTLYSYSPYHNIRDGQDYPAILVTTADTDDRVVPGHSFKYAAALQAADIGPRPRLIRIETRAGHGSGKPTDKVIDEAADLWAFAAKWTGMKVKGRAPVPKARQPRLQSRR